MATATYQRLNGDKRFDVSVSGLQDQASPRFIVGTQSINHESIFKNV